jgi:hypothetical protein
MSTVCWSVHLLIGWLFMYLLKRYGNGTVPVTGSIIISLQRLEVCTKAKTHQQQAGVLGRW